MVKNDKFKISIIIPVFNVEDYLEECLESIVNQRFDLNDLEIIMVNDGSTDKSSEIMDNYSGKYNNFLSIHLSESSGAAGFPRNVGLEKARADFIMFLDSDDLYVPDTCRIMYETINEYNSDLVICGHNRFNSTFDNYHRLVNEVIINKSFFEEPIFTTFAPASGSKIYRKQNLIKNNISFPVGVIGQDSVFSLKCFLTSEKITALPVSLYRYRIREDINNKSKTQLINSTFFNDFNHTRKLNIEISESYNYDYMENWFHTDIDYAFWMLSNSDFINTENGIREILEGLSWFVEKGEKYLKKCRKSDSIIIKKLLQKDFENAAKTFHSFTELRYLESIITTQRMLIDRLKLRIK